MSTESTLPNLTWEQLSQARTVRNIPFLDIPAELDKPHGDWAYEPLNDPGFGGADMTNLASQAVFDRLAEVFGPNSDLAGWKVTYNITIQRTERAHIVEIDNFIFHYSLILPDGRLLWTQTSPVSAGDSNRERTYAVGGALTSAFKLALRGMLLQGHIRRGEKTHHNNPKPKKRRGGACEDQPAARSSDTVGLPADKIGSTGLTHLAADTKISAMKWDWLEKDARERLLAKFGEGTLGELPKEARDFLRAVRTVPPELKKFLSQPATSEKAADQPAEKTAPKPPTDQPAATPPADQPTPPRPTAAKPPAAPPPAEKAA